MSKEKVHIAWQIRTRLCVNQLNCNVLWMSSFRNLIDLKGKLLACNSVLKAIHLTSKNLFVKKKKNQNK